MNDIVKNIFNWVISFVRSDKGKNFFLWIIAIILTAGLVIYQRSTGPTYPVRGSITIDGELIKYKLIRTFWWRPGCFGRN